MNTIHRVLVGCLLVAAGAAPTSAGPTPPKSPELVAKGKALFATTCVPCHGETGEGNGAAAAALVPKPRNFKAEPFKFGTKPAEVFATLEKGSPGTAMAPFVALPEEDRWALVYYVLSLRGDADAKAASKGKGRK